jgi:hypothetical protein
MHPLISEDILGADMKSKNSVPPLVASLSGRVRLNHK